MTIKVRAGRGRQWAERSPGAYAAEPRAEGSWGPGAQGTAAEEPGRGGATRGWGKPALTLPPSPALGHRGTAPLPQHVGALTVAE